MFIAKPCLPNFKRRGRGMWLLAIACSSIHPQHATAATGKPGFANVNDTRNLFAAKAFVEIHRRKVRLRSLCCGVQLHSLRRFCQRLFARRAPVRKRR